MKIERLDELTREYMWLKEIVEAHSELIRIITEREGYFRVSSICDGETSYSINPHHSIPDKYLIDGLKASVDNCKKRMQEIKVLCEC